MTDDWISAIDNNKYVGTLFLDLSKAFDLVNHDILLQKLKSFSFHSSTLQWFSSYLRHRSQFVQVHGISSGCLPVVSGVPQGSVLGPILFLLYINDLPESVLSSIVDIFADDTTLSVSNCTLETIVNCLNSDLLNIENWCVSNKMCVNPEKTKIMYFSSQRKANCISEAASSVQYNGSSIEKSMSEKLLGVTLDTTFSWDSHVSTVLKKCNSLLYLLSRIKVFLSIPQRKLFFNSYILPHLDYCCVVWGNLNVSLESKIVRFQKTAARLILESDMSVSSESLFTQLDWLTFPERVKFHKAILMYKIFHDQAPTYLKSLFTYSSSIHNLNLRSSSDLQLYTLKYRCEFFNCIINLLHSLKPTCGTRFHIIYEMLELLQLLNPCI